MASHAICACLLWFVTGWLSNEAELLLLGAMHIGRLLMRWRREKGDVVIIVLGTEGLLY